MAKDPYTVLGVPRTASEEEVRAAYRRLAKQNHPDRNPNDKAAEERFKEASAAFDILGDKEKRAKFDRGDIDADGRERASQFREWGPGPNGGVHAGGRGGGGFDDLGDIFSDLFGRRSAAARGRDLRYRLEVDFLDAANGATRRVSMPDGRTLDVAIPKGLADGQTLRLRGQGEPGRGGPAGDVYVEVRVKPHPYFERDGADVRIEAPVTLKEAVLGGKITIPTISGPVSVTVPKNTSSGAVLRLRGKGLKDQRSGEAGDQYVKLRIVLPDAGDPALEAFVRNWDGAGPNPRKKTFRG